MTALGHFRHINTLLALAACPLRSDLAQICARRQTDVEHQNPEIASSRQRQRYLGKSN